MTQATYDFTTGDDNAAATNHYAGPFCNCGDYSCPASNNDTAECVNTETPSEPDPWCPCYVTDCTANTADAPCSYPPHHPIHA